MLKFVAASYEGILPDGGDIPGPLTPEGDVDVEFINDVNGLLKEYIDAMDAVKLRLGLQLVMHVSARGNGYLQAAGLSNTLKKDDPKRCAQVVARAINLIYILSALTYPFMPATSQSILQQLNAPARAVPEVIAYDILAGHTLNKPEHLFKKIDEKMADVWKAKFAGNAPVAAAPDPDATHVLPGASKKKAKSTKTPGAADTGPKSAEVLAWEQKVSDQGQIVRDLKTTTPKTAEVDEQIAAAVVELKKLKIELAEHQKQT